MTAGENAQVAARQPLLARVLLFWAPLLLVVLGTVASLVGMWLLVMAAPVVLAVATACVWAYLGEFASRLMFDGTHRSLRVRRPLHRAKRLVDVTRVAVRPYQGWESAWPLAVPLVPIRLVVQTAGNEEEVWVWSWTRGLAALLTKMQAAGVEVVPWSLLPGSGVRRADKVRQLLALGAGGFLFAAGGLPLITVTAQFAREGRFFWGLPPAEATLSWWLFLLPVYVFVWLTLIGLWAWRLGAAGWARDAAAAEAVGEGPLSFLGWYRAESSDGAMVPPIWGLTWATTGSAAPQPSEAPAEAS